MITNAREYQITRAQVAKLAAALKSAQTHALPRDVHPAIRKAELTAIESEINRLQGELAAYDELLEGRKLRLENVPLEDLPDVLIKARIANRWSQKQVAERLGIHEQQVQRYEASRYRGTSFERLLEIARLLGVRVQQDVVLAAPAWNNARTSLKKLGFSDEFIERRVLSPVSAIENDPAMAMPALDRVHHIFGWTLEQLARPETPRVPARALGGARFKVPKGRSSAYLEAYTAYAFRLASGAARCAEHLPRHRFPPDWQTSRKAILEGGAMTLTRVIDWMWELGVVVLPLFDRAAFNAAFWRIEGRNVVIIKQKTESPDRLIHDLLHEGYHASQQPEIPNRAVMDVEHSTDSDPEEVAANTFASDVLLNGRANELVREVAQVAGGFGPALKAAVPSVAERNGVSVGALANHLAWVLERQHTPINWWGTAHNLQGNARTDLEYARTQAFQRLVPPPDIDVDVDLLFRELRTTGSS